APYQEALERARQEHREQVHKTGRGDETLIDSDIAQTRLNHTLEYLNSQSNQPRLLPIPGFYTEGYVTDPPALVGDPFPGLILGREIIARRYPDGKYDRRYTRGTLVTLTLWATSARGQVDPIPIKQPFRYADDSRTGIYEIDSQHVYCDFDLLQKLLQMGATTRVDDEGNPIGTAPARCSQIQIKLADGVDALALTSRLEELYWSYLDDPRFRNLLDLTDRHLLSGIDVMTWQESQASIVAAVEKEKILMTIVLMVISLVAVALLLCILYMIVLQKTRDIGIVKAIGGSSGGVAMIFLLYGGTAGLVGSAMGLVFGGLFITYINEIQDFLIAVNPAWRVWNLEVYSFDRIPSQVDPWDAFAVVAIATVASTIGSLFAAWRAGAMQPVEAIRHE
ncbi:MAG: FtsX-like permease family protein, partial [Planctomycetota bacterium]